MKFCFLLILLLSQSALSFDSRLITTRRELERTSLLFFQEHAHPQTGLVRDKANNFGPTPAHNRMASMAATGFGLAVISHATTRNLVNRTEARDYVRKTLKFTLDHVPHYRGWITHFADWESGSALPGSEYSTIDTALFVAGALYAAQILKDPVIDDLTYRIYDRVDFQGAMTDDGKKPQKRSISLSYTPEAGWTSYQWNVYAEQKILLLLGLGHPSRPLPRESWFAWTRALNGVHMPLFIHHYSLVFFDFRNFKDGFENYFQSGLKSTLVNRNVGKSQRQFKTFQEGFWGLSAGEDPEGYRVYSPVNFNGTVCLGCALGSAMYAPELIVGDAAKWLNSRFKLLIWGRYGFTDSINVDKNWYSPYVLGITAGPLYMSLNNMEGRTSVWKDFMAVPAMKKALRVINKTRETHSFLSSCTAETDCRHLR